MVDDPVEKKLKEIDIDELVSKEENERVEFKNQDILNDNEKLIERIVGFTNKLDNGGGILLIGVNDDKTYGGLKFNKSDEEKIMQICRDKCRPPVQVIFRCIQKPNGDIYVILIPGRKLGFPHGVKRKDELLFYVRTGSITKLAAYEELQILFNEKLDVEMEKKEKEEIKQPFKIFDDSIPFLDYQLIPKKLDDILPMSNRGTLEFLMQNRPNDIAIGELETRQNSFVFEGKTQFGLRALQVTKSGIINYKESLNDTVNIGRMIVVIGNIFSFAKKIYKNYDYSDHIFLKIMLGNIKDFMLATSPGRDILPHKSDDENIMIERNYLMGQDPSTLSVTESIVSEVCRSFGFLIDDDVLHDHVFEMLKKLNDC